MSHRKKIICTVINSVEYDQRMQRICSSLQIDGFDVLLLGRQTYNNGYITNRIYKQRELQCIFNKGKLMYLEYNIRLFFYLLTKRCDILCGVDLDTILPIIIISKLKRIPSLYDAHEYFPGVPEVASRPIIKKIWEWIERFTFKHVSGVYTVSQSIAELFEKKYRRKVSLVRNMPIEKPMPSKLLKIPRSLIYQGALNMGRGLEYIIHSMRYIEGTLHIAGEGDLSDYLRDLAIKLNLLNTKVKFLGMISPTDLPDLTNRMTIGINLLESTSASYYYSLSNKTFDYIQAGIPQICINFPEYKRLNDEFQVMQMVSDFKIETLTQAINQLFDDPIYYQQLCYNCTKAAGELIWENEAPRLLEIYHPYK